MTRDIAANAVAAMSFSFALGIATVALPLLALATGYSAAAVGLLTAASAISQMATRMVLAGVMRRYPDRYLVTGACVLLAASSGLVVMSAAVVPFVIAELLQGSARGLFWTGSQTHVVRGEGSAVARLAAVNFISSIGLLSGPLAAGVLIERSAATALVVATAAALLAAGPTLAMDRLPPFVVVHDAPPGRFWRRPGVDMGCWAGVTAGAWRGLVSSYIPVALERAGQSSATIGALVSVANGSSIVGAGAVARVRAARVRPAYIVTTLAAGVGTALAGFVAPAAGAAAVVIALSGLGAGALQTLGPAVATDAVHPEERGEAIAVAGTFRAAALFASPLAVAGMLSVIALAPAMAVTGAVLALPALSARRRQPAVTRVPEVACAVR